MGTITPKITAYPEPGNPGMWRVEWLGMGKDDEGGPVEETRWQKDL